MPDARSAKAAPARTTAAAEDQTSPVFHSAALHKSPLWSRHAPPVQAKLLVNAPGDAYEQEADRAADQVVDAAAPKVQTPPGRDLHPYAGAAAAPAASFSAAPALIQREEDKTGDVLSEGAEITYEQMEDQPGFEEWQKRQTDALKLKLWDNQPTDFKAGIVSFGLGSAGLLGFALALDPAFRAKTGDALQDINLALPLGLVPKSEYFLLSSFKYKLPAATAAPYTFETELSFDEWFKLMQEKLNTPQIDLSVGIDSSYSQAAGFTPVTGGNIKLKFGGGIVNLSAFYNQPLPPTPVLISDHSRGERPMWLMRSLPSQLEENLPKGSGVFLTIDVLRLPQLFAPGRGSSPVQRKAEGESADSTTAAPASVERTLRSDGAPLDPQTKRLMESRFDQDFAHVRIHTGAQAAQSAHSLRARAYTSGAHIVFGRGQFQPHTKEGRRLIAHELAHVVQQTGGVRRKEDDAPSSLAQDLRAELEDKGYPAAYSRLTGALGAGQNALPAVKTWLAANPDIRDLFLKKLPAALLAGDSSEDELLLMPQADAFAVIDCWYQSEDEKQKLYAGHMRLFDYLLASISPYTGVAIASTVAQLMGTLAAGRAYTGSGVNAEFHTIHLLAPTVERKIKFYHTYGSLFATVKRKFDPFSGISLATMASLSGTKDISQEKARHLYKTFENLPAEQRQAFIDTAQFAGGLEADKDAQQYYKQTYGGEYKALPHAWKFAPWPWEWDAPFADRRTVDPVAEMSAALSYDYVAQREFDSKQGIKGGVSGEEAQRLLDQLQNDRNFYDERRLAILLAIAVRGGLADRVTTKVLLPKNDARPLAGTILKVVEGYGFQAAEGFKYKAENEAAARGYPGYYWYVLRQTLFGGKSGKVRGEQRGTFDLRRLQDSDDFLGSLGGMRFGRTVYQGDQYYSTTWLDAAVKAWPGADTLLANLQATQGQDRSGKIFASIRDDIRQAHVFAATLPVEGFNLFSAPKLFRSGPGVLQGLAVHLEWTKDTDEPDNSITLQLDIDNLLLNQIEIVGPDGTMTLGQVGVKGFRVRLAQINLAAAEGFVAGLLKNVDFMRAAFTTLLPNMLKLLFYAVKTAIEELKGGQDQSSRNELGQVLTNDFSALDASVTFTSLQVRNLYDTASGFLDDISVEQWDEHRKPVRQGLHIRETLSWTVDAGFKLKDKIRLIDEEVRAAQSELAGTDHAARMAKLEAEKQDLLREAGDKALRYENRDKEMNSLRAVTAELRRLESELKALYDQAVRDNPNYDDKPFRVWTAQRARMLADLGYIDEDYAKESQTKYSYFDDKKIVEQSSDPAARYQAQRRMQEFEAKYKSVDVTAALRNVTLHGGDYVRNMINEAVKSIGLIKPKLEGIENINIGAIDSAFTAGGLGVASRSGAAGVAVKDVRVPLIAADAIALRTAQMLVKGDLPRLEDVHLSLRIDFAKNPLAKNPEKPYGLLLQQVTVGRATFSSLTVKTGSAEPLIDFPAAVEAWGLELSNFDPAAGNIDLKINDIRAQGAYKDEDKDKQTSRAVMFDVDSTENGAPRLSAAPALELHYNRAKNSISTGVDLRSVRIPSLAIQSRTLSIASLPGTEAVALENVQAQVKVTFGEGAKGDTPATPDVVDINSLHIGKASLAGITMTLREEEKEEEGGAKKQNKPPGAVQVVTLPKEEPVTVENLKVEGLRLTVGEDATSLSAIDNRASVHLGKTNAGGLEYKEMSARGSVLTALTVQRGMLDALDLDAINRKGRLYNKKEFFKFFGHTALAGADIKGSYTRGKNSGIFAVEGQAGAPITVDYIEPDDKPGYYKIRLPLKRIALPALHVEKDEHTIDIPKARNAAATSALDDVLVTLRATVEFDAEGKVQYDAWLDQLEAAELKVYGLEYTDKANGVKVAFDAARPLHVPNIKAGGFHFSSAKALDVFGKEGGWIKAAASEGDVISAHVARISAALSSGTFLAEGDAAAGRSALDVDIASFGFTYDKAGVMTITLGKIAGGFPKVVISQTDSATGAMTKTTVSSAGNQAVTAAGVVITLTPVGADQGAGQNTVIDAKGLSAGSLIVTSEEKRGEEVSTTTMKLDPAAIGAQSAVVKLNADKSKEITIKDIRGGKINLDFLSTGPKGRSQNTVTLPDPESIRIEELKIAIDAEGKRRITVVKPTIKNVTLRQPSQTKDGDYVKVTCDLAVDGNIELGDGNFDTLTLGGSVDAIVGLVQDDVPVEIKNVRVEILDTSESAPDKNEGGPQLTPDQEKLIELEKARDSAEAKMRRTPERRGRGDYEDINPAYTKAREEYLAADKAYADHKAKLVGAAKAAAQASMTKKYLDAVTGSVTASLRVFNSEIPLNVETHQGKPYVELSKRVTDGLKLVIIELVKSTADMPFWRSEDMKAIGAGLRRWYLYVSNHTAAIAALVEAIARGYALQAVQGVLASTDMWPGVLDTDDSLYGINMNLEISLALDATPWDSKGIGLCERKNNKHPLKDDFYSLYGIIEYLQFVSPALVTQSDHADAQRLHDLANGARESAQEVGNKDIAAAVNELVLFIKANLNRERKRLTNTLLDNIKGVKVNADVSLRPQEVITALLQEKGAGSLTFDKGKNTIDNLHVEGAYTNPGANTATGEAAFTVGGGAAGVKPIPIPGATYLSQNQGTKVSFTGLDISPITLSYKNKTYRLESGQFFLKGLKFGVRTKNTK